MNEEGEKDSGASSARRSQKRGGGSMIVGEGSPQPL